MRAPLRVCDSRAPRVQECVAHVAKERPVLLRVGSSREPHGSLEGSGFGSDLSMVER